MKRNTVKKPVVLDAQEAPIQTMLQVQCLGSPVFFSFNYRLTADCFLTQPVPLGLMTGVMCTCTTEQSQEGELSGNTKTKSHYITEKTS